MKKKIPVFTLCAMLFALCLPADAQQPGKIFRIGFLDDSTASNIAVRLDTFRQELSKLGWIEGKNVAIEYRYAEGKLERLPELTSDLVRLRVDLIVAQGTPGALAAKNATTTIPIVMTDAGERHSPPTERAQGCGYDTEAKIGGDRCSTRRQRLR